MRKARSLIQGLVVGYLIVLSTATAWFFLSVPQYERDGDNLLQNSNFISGISGWNLVGVGSAERTLVQAARLHIVDKNHSISLRQIVKRPENADGILCAGLRAVSAALSHSLRPPNDNSAIHAAGPSRLK